MKESLKLRKCTVLMIQKLEELAPLLRKQDSEGCNGHNTGFKAQCRTRNKVHNHMLYQEKRF